MDCEFCSLEGTAGEASIRCTTCGEWMCDEHVQYRTNGTPLCPSCFEIADEEVLEAESAADAEEPD